MAPREPRAGGAPLAAEYGDDLLLLHRLLLSRQSLQERARSARPVPAL
jgi:hypothetical protein